MKAWLHSIVAAAISAAASAFVSVVVSPATFNTSSTGLEHLASVCGISAALAVAGLLVKSPLGASAPDPAALAKSGSSAAMIAVMAGSLFAASTLSLTGCTQAQKISVAQEIVNWTPAFDSALDTAGGILETLDPVTAPIVNTVVGAADALAPQFETAAKNYLANPNQTTLQVLQGLVVQIQNSVNSSLTLLTAAHIENQQSLRLALAAINGIGTVVNTVLGLIQSISSKAQIAAMSSQVTVHLATVQGVLDRNGMQLAANKVSQDLQLPAPLHVDTFLQLEARAGF